MDASYLRSSPEGRFAIGANRADIGVNELAAVVKSTDPSSQGGLHPLRDTGRAEGNLVET